MILEFWDGKKRDEKYILWKEGNKEKLLMFLETWNLKVLFNTADFSPSPQRVGSDYEQSVSSGFINCEEELKGQWVESCQTTLLTQAAY